jgi:hypothetical protein
MADLDERDARVCVKGNEPIEISKEYGPLVFWSLRVTASIDRCEWIVEQEAPDGWREIGRFDGQPFDYYRDEPES